MKKLIAGLGLTVLAVPSAQAWTGGIEDMRTMRANEQGPFVRIKSYHTQTVHCGHCNTRQSWGKHRPHHNKQNHATGWQRGAGVHPHSRRIPAKPVQMHAYPAPHQAAKARPGTRVHRITGPVRNPMCRYR